MKVINRYKEKKQPIIPTIVASLYFLIEKRKPKKETINFPKILELLFNSILKFCKI